MRTSRQTNENARASELPSEEAASLSSLFSAVDDETAEEIDDAFVSVLVATG
jgi:hypothetical protein